MYLYIKVVYIGFIPSKKGCKIENKVKLQIEYGLEKMITK